MAQYINKSALVVEIKKLMYAANTEADIASTGECFNKGIANAKYQLCKYFLGVIDTLEVKEVDLEKEIPMWIKENPRERPFDDGWFIGMDDCLHRNGYKIKICDLWNLPKESFNSKEFEMI